MATQYKREPTEIQKRAVNAVLAGENNLGRAMRGAGYSTKSSENPKQNLMERRGVQEYLNLLDDKAKNKFNMSTMEKALTVYLEALQAVLPHLIGMPDHKTRLMAADRLVNLFMAAQQREVVEKQQNAMSYSAEERKTFNDTFREYLRHLQYNSSTTNKDPVEVFDKK